MARIVCVDGPRDIRVFMACLWICLCTNTWHTNTWYIVHIKQLTHYLHFWLKISDAFNVITS